MKDENDGVLFVFGFDYGEKEDVISRGPVIYEKGVTYMFVQHNNLYLLTASRQNCNAASLLLFLHRVIKVIILETNSSKTLRL